ncbi:MAG TPA: Gfo/Idh/MocA family oxidoreductase [Flavobacteriales bacterium]|nr:Gfo/Idh/MocA family oxidoreductase [Flavobacteriales bacterium]
MSSRKNLSRRGFLKGAAAAATAPLFLPACATTRRSHPGANDIINVVAVGVGWQGTSNLEGFLGNNTCRVIAVCDIDAQHLAATQAMVNKAYGNQDCKTYHRFEELYDREDIDAVSIALPDHWHAIPAIAAAKKGFDIYGEKPLAHSWAEGRAIVDAVDKNNCIWQTGSWQRSVDNFRHGCELVRNGYIGKITRVEVGLYDGYSDYAKTGDQTAFVQPPAHLDYDRWLGPAQVAAVVLRVLEEGVEVADAHHIERAADAISVVDAYGQGHITAVAAPGHHHPIGVKVRLLSDPIEQRADVLHALLALVPVVQVEEGLAIAAAAAHVGIDDGHAELIEEVVVPPLEARP